MSNSDIFRIDARWRSNFPGFSSIGGDISAKIVLFAPFSAFSPQFLRLPRSNETKFLPPLHWTTLGKPKI